MHQTGAKRRPRRRNPGNQPLTRTPQERSPCPARTPSHLNETAPSARWFDNSAVSPCARWDRKGIAIGSPICKKPRGPCDPPTRAEQVAEQGSPNHNGSRGSTLPPIFVKRGEGLASDPPAPIKVAIMNSLLQRRGHLTRHLILQLARTEARDRSIAKMLDDALAFAARPRRPKPKNKTKSAISTGTSYAVSTLLWTQYINRTYLRILSGIGHAPRPRIWVGSQARRRKKPAGGFPREVRRGDRKAPFTAQQGEMNRSSASRLRGFWLTEAMMFVLANRQRIT